ncbi:MAG: hypothetical protein U5N86_13240 [Planctomycetota bacterium]|nr:hypothetical protein [Planctomycetota bacterium]
MKRLIGISLVLLLVAGLYGFAWGEEEQQKSDIDPLNLISNEGFEEPVAEVDPHATFPYGWHKFVAQGNGNSVALNVRERGGENIHGIHIATDNPKAKYTNAAYASFPCADKLRAITGKTIRFEAKVKVYKASGQRMVDGKATRIEGIKKLVMGEDFGKNEVLDYTNYAGLNLLFMFNPKLPSAEGIEGLESGTIVPPAKTRLMAFSPTDDYVTLYVEATVPENVNEAMVMLECKGQAEAIFEDLKLTYPENGEAALKKPFNLDLNALIPVNRKQPKEWFFRPGGQQTYFNATTEKKVEGEYSLEIGNPNPLNLAENIAFTVNFDIGKNRSLRGKKIRMTAKVLSQMAPGVTPSGTCMGGIREARARRGHRGVRRRR